VRPIDEAGVGVASCAIATVPSWFNPRPRTIAVRIMIRVRPGALRDARRAGPWVPRARSGELDLRAGIGLNMTAIVAARDADLEE
jgi:hypothetical protein